MPAETSTRCSRCYVSVFGEPFLMAGRTYCCDTCSVGSVCEHQGIHRSPNMRRFDTMFAPFRAVARHASPYEFDQPHAGGDRHA